MICCARKGGLAIRFLSTQPEESFLFYLSGRARTIYELHLWEVHGALGAPQSPTYKFSPLIRSEHFHMLVAFYWGLTHHRVWACWDPLVTCKLSLGNAFDCAFNNFMGGADGHAEKCPTWIHACMCMVSHFRGTHTIFFNA